MRECASSSSATSFLSFFWGGFDRRSDNVSAGTGLGTHSHTCTIDNWRVCCFYKVFPLQPDIVAAVFDSLSNSFIELECCPIEYHRSASLRIGRTAHALRHLINLWIYNPRIILPISTIYYQILGAFICARFNLSRHSKAQAKAKVLFDTVRR